MNPPYGRFKSQRPHQFHPKRWKVYGRGKNWNRGDSGMMSTVSVKTWAKGALASKLCLTINERAPDIGPAWMRMNVDARGSMQFPTVLKTLAIKLNPKLE
jgi:hypothetical protein